MHTRVGDKNDSPPGPDQAGPAFVSLPKGGGAIRGIDEKFSVNPATGTGSLSVPIFTTPGRSDFYPKLSLSYDSGAGNGPFGFGWSLSVPSITRKTDKGLPRYEDDEESDVFILSGAEDLVPVLTGPQGSLRRETSGRTAGGVGYTVERYRPRVEGLFARIERWRCDEDGEVHWRSISRDNVTTVYGRTSESRITDPRDPTRVFSWLVCESYDDRGNSIVYEYKPEDAVGVERSRVEEKNRLVNPAFANRYLKRIKYGNRRSRLLEPDPAGSDWAFEVVFDYGEHYVEDAQGQPLSVDGEGRARQWAVRPDPFSSYRAGFEVRTYRLCRRVLLFHHFPAELGGGGYLTRSTDIAYDESPVATFVRYVTQSGYVRRADGTYLKRSLPPLEFGYSRPQVDETVRDVDAENLPQGVGGAAYQWADLDGEGLPGVLTEQADAWYYNRNHGGRFGPHELVTTKPSADLSPGGAQLIDLAGDGQLDVVLTGGPVRGFFERTGQPGWSAFRAFASWPSVDTRDPNTRLVDLNGDGHADLLLTEEEAFTWHASLAEEGFGPAERVGQESDEERGPRLVFDDGTESVYLSDMSGDGLSDLVRIRNGEVCYWPNLGYGRFGAKVTMRDAPVFDSPDQFNQKRIRLADIDGSGVTDIIYLGRDGVRFWFNESGNGWGEPQALAAFPPADEVASVSVVDLMGDGTACLVWSSPLPGAARRPMRYVALMGGKKPHLLESIANNLGAESVIHYAPSTQFYLADKLAGRPWVTRLPFPVHVVERVETYDHIGRSRFVTRYAYHHGYFDGAEREFRGFGLIEQRDTEDFDLPSRGDAAPRGDNFDASSRVPPVLTRTWYHTGAYVEGGRISGHFEHEYYREPDAAGGRSGAMLLDDTVLPDTARTGGGRRAPHALSAAETAEACRALKGQLLRQEIYALDHTDRSDRPYSVSERSYTIELLQPRAANRHAVFFTHAREAVDFHYERELFEAGGGASAADPRVTHTLSLAVDDYGNVLLSAAVGYGRRFKDLSLAPADQDKQAATFVTYTESAYTGAVLRADDYRAPAPCESRTYEVVKAAPRSAVPGATNLFRFDEMLDLLSRAGDGSHDLSYEDVTAASATEDRPYRRLIEHTRTLYRSDDLTGPREGLLPLGALEARAAQGESYKLAFTPALLAAVYERDGQSLLPDPAGVLKAEGGYTSGDEFGSENLFPRGDPEGLWWVPSGRSFFSPDRRHVPAEELDFARKHFFLPHRFRDPFGQDTLLGYDGHCLAPVESTDALHNRTSAAIDYRVLQPFRVEDPNGNLTEVRFDALGMVAGVAVKGAGDTLDDFEPDLEDSQLDAFYDAEDPHLPAPQMLKGATTRVIYDPGRFRRTRQARPDDPGRWQPAYTATLARESHVNEQPPGGLKIQIGFSYSDGFGREIQKKIQAEPGPLVRGGPPVSPRWVGSGWVIYNNKGQPVRQYEPFFSRLAEKRHRFEFGATFGVSPLLFYDPVGRVVATLRPNHTYEKVVFDPWRQSTYDVNDTVTFDPATDEDVGPFFERLPGGEYLPTWHQLRVAPGAGAAERGAAQKAARHADTPGVAHLDSLGRTFLTVADNGEDAQGAPRKYPTRFTLDIEGNEREVRDALTDAGDDRGRVAMRYDYDMLGNRVRQASADAGERWALNDVAGKPIRRWDGRGHEFTHKYDELRRPAETRVKGGEAVQLDNLFEKIVYGEGKTSGGRTDVELNLRGKPFEHYDTAGKVRFELYDFKGNLRKSRRRLASNYKEPVHWDAADPDLLLDDEDFLTETKYDALNRVLWQRTPDASVTRPLYNEANLLEAVEVERGGDTTPFVTDINYNEKGQRLDITYGNGVRTAYEYERETFRLARLETRKADGELLQDLLYTYDPVGNVTQVEDRARPTIFFGNAETLPVNAYTYDPLYRLTAAEGREHIAQVAFGVEDNWNDLPFLKKYNAGDPLAWRTYTEDYLYDAVGNILRVEHRAAGGGWTRDYDYEAANNRLKSTTVRAENGTFTYPYEHHTRHGFIRQMPHLQVMEWNFKDELQAVVRQRRVDGGTPETTYYVYDSAGQRVRKVTEAAADPGATPAARQERIYLGAVEIYREHTGTNAGLERRTLHVMDDRRRVAMVETRNDVDDGSPRTLARYQFTNHLGTACLETDAAARVISYEEYHPYGTTSYQAVDREVKAAAKRYRYSGKERDEESGFYYYGARYYAPWLARWVSYEPLGLIDGVNLYQFVRSNPVVLLDPNGTQAEVQPYGSPPTGPPPIYEPPPGQIPRAVPRTPPVVPPEPVPPPTASTALVEGSAGAAESGVLGDALSVLKRGAGILGLLLMVVQLENDMGVPLSAPGEPGSNDPASLPGTTDSQNSVGEPAVGGEPIEAPPAASPSGPIEEPGDKSQERIKAGGLRGGQDTELPEGTHKIVEDPNEDATQSATDPEVLGAALESAGQPRLPNHEPHHIVASNDRRAERAREILEEAGISINDAANGVWLARVAKGSETPRGIQADAFTSHDSVHSDAYYEALTERLETVGPEGAAAELETIGVELQLGIFPW